MTTHSPTTDSTPTHPAQRPDPGGDRHLRPLLLRLHFLAGLFVGPFLLVAAVSGTLYAATPQLEDVVYRHQLHVTPSATALPLADQVQAAVDARGGAAPVAVRPAPGPTNTTRVLFADPTLGESERRAVFVDPGTGAVRGELTVYGTSGVLPLRTWVSELHRSLHLGTPGRLYSELAASWLAVLVVSGLVLWTARAGRRVLRPDRALRGTPGTRTRLRTRHAVLGTALSVGLLGLAATGLTWSGHAGARVDALRQALSWTAPVVDTSLTPTPAPSPHAGHAGHPAGSGTNVTALADTAPTDTAPADIAPADIALVLDAARAAGLTAAKVEVKAPAATGTAWKVDEIDRGLHTQVDSAAVALTGTGSGATAQVVDVVRFDDHPFPAKLARWGVDLHMGSFGVGNQLALLVLGVGLTALVLLGYRTWWARRAVMTTPHPDAVPGHRTWLRPPPRVLAAVVLVAAVLGWALPVLGVSLAALVLLDVLHGTLRRTRSR